MKLRTHGDMEALAAAAGLQIKPMTVSSMGTVYKTINLEVEPSRELSISKIQ
jgi:hypothetical protein